MLETQRSLVTLDSRDERVRHLFLQGRRHPPGSSLESPESPRPRSRGNSRLPVSRVAWRSAERLANPPAAAQRPVPPWAARTRAERVAHPRCRGFTGESHARLIVRRRWPRQPLSDGASGKRCTWDSSSFNRPAPSVVTRLAVQSRTRLVSTTPYPSKRVARSRNRTLSSPPEHRS